MAEERRRDYESWHLDKRVNIGHITTTLTIAAAMIAWAMSMDSRMTRLEVQQEHGQKVAEEIKEELKDMNRKIDKLIERILNGNGHTH